MELTACNERASTGTRITSGFMVHCQVRNNPPCLHRLHAQSRKFARPASRMRAAMSQSASWHGSMANGVGRLGVVIVFCHVLMPGCRSATCGSSRRIPGSVVLDLGRGFELDLQLRFDRHVRGVYFNASHREFTPKTRPCPSFKAEHLGVVAKWQLGNHAARQCARSGAGKGPVVHSRSHRAARAERPLASPDAGKLVH